MSATAEDVRWNGLQDRLRIEDQLSNLGRCLDEHDFEGMRMLFTHDANGVDTGRRRARSRRDRRAGPAAAPLVRGRPAHLITNALIERNSDGDSDSVDGDRASVRANLFVSLAAGNVDPVPFLVGGVYRFTLRRTAEGWRIETLRSTSTWSMNRPTA